MPIQRATFADKTALLASGRPWIVAPAEVAKSTAAYRTDAEILLGCIIVSGTLDTSQVLSAIIHQDARIALNDEQETAYQAFRRVWQSPTAAERAKVIDWASRIAAKPRREWRWATPT